MELNEKFIARLEQDNPGRKFQLLGKVDPDSYTTRYVLSVDGRATPYGYLPELYDRFVKEHGWTESMIVEHFVAGTKGILFL